MTNAAINTIVQVSLGDADFIFLGTNRREIAESYGCPIFNYLWKRYHFQ